MGITKCLGKIIFLSILFANIVPLSNAEQISNISAKSILITDLGSGEVLLAKNDTAQRSIASITKMMTVITILEAQQDLYELLEIQRLRTMGTHIPPNIKYLPRDKIIELAMVSSDNTAAYNLCYHYVGGYNNCIINMNEIARRWGLHNTEFVDPTGLHNQNVSSADDLAKILNHSLSYSYLKYNGALLSTDINYNKSKLNLLNTNKLLSVRNDILVTKTGWITASGGCIAMIVVKHAKKFAVIILGSQNTRTRLTEANQLINTYIN